MPNQPSADVIVLLQLLYDEGVRSDAQIGEAIRVDGGETAGVVLKASQSCLIGSVREGGERVWGITDAGRIVLDHYRCSHGEEEVRITVDFQRPMREDNPEFERLSYRARVEQVDDLKFPVRVAAFAAEYWPDGFENGDATHLGDAFVDMAASGDLLISVVMAVQSRDVQTLIAQRAKRVLETLAVQMHP